MSNKLLIIVIIFCTATAVEAEYNLPSNNADCPTNCRTTEWSAGTDQWNNGVIPSYNEVSCTSGLTEGDGTVDNRSAIQACINSAPSNTAVVLPAGIYYVNGSINMKSNVVLKGSGTLTTTWLPAADATVTTLKLGNSGTINFGSSSPTRGSAVALASGTHQKGTRTVNTATSHGLSVGDWFVMYENADSTIPVTANGSDGTCSWCGEDNGTSFLGNYNQVTAVNSSTQITVLRPLPYDFKSSLSATIKKITWNVKYAGLQNMRINGWGANHSGPQVKMSGALYCWLYNVELYNDYDYAKAWHVFVQYSHGNEFNHCYIHKQRANSSDRAYGIGYFFSTSDNKIVDCIIREVRHGTAQEGGGVRNDS